MMHENYHYRDGNSYQKQRDKLARVVFARKDHMRL